MLGYKLERRLHDAKIDYLIDEFRKHFPLNKDDNKKLEDVLQLGQEKIVPRDLTDGLVVFKNWKRLIDNIASSDVANIKKFMEDDVHVPGWKPFYSEIKNKYAVNDAEILHFIGQLKPELNFLSIKLMACLTCALQRVFSRQSVGIFRDQEQSWKG